MRAKADLNVHAKIIIDGGIAVYQVATKGK